MQESIKVSVCCITYNHAKNLRQCFDGFLMQKTNFKYEILVHDDASTDGTIDIINEYASKYPDLINPYIQKENQYSKGNGFVGLTINFNRAKGKYIALCEGDDYWTDPLKLQKQVDFLDMHPKYSAVTGNAIRIKEDGTKIGLFSTTPSRDLTDMGEIVRSRQFHTASILYNREAYQKAPMYNSANGWDTWQWCCLMSQGPIRYEDEVNCIYRCGTGVTSSTKRIKWILIQEKWENRLFESFSPQYITYNDAYYPLLMDVFSVMTNKDTSIEDKKQLRALFKKYITPSLFMEMVPMMFKHYASRLKRTLTKR